MQSTLKVRRPSVHDNRPRLYIQVEYVHARAVCDEGGEQV